MTARTCCEKCDGFHAAKLSGVHMQRLELLDLLLEDPDVVHEGDHPVSGHGGGVEARGCQEGRDVKGHVALGGVKDEQFGPDEPQERHLVCQLELREAGDVAGPLNRREEQLGRELADGVQAGDVVDAELGSVSPGVGLRSDQRADVGAEEGRAAAGQTGRARAREAARVIPGPEAKTHQTLGAGRTSALLDGCKRMTG